MSIDLREWLPGHTIATAPPEGSDTRTGHVPDTGVETPGFREGMWAVSPYNFDERVREDMHLPARSS